MFDFLDKGSNTIDKTKAADENLPIVERLIYRFVSTLLPYVVDNQLYIFKIILLFM
jgi:hypothetical protein